MAKTKMTLSVYRSLNLTKGLVLGKISYQPHLP